MRDLTIGSFKVHYPSELPGAEGTHAVCQEDHSRANGLRIVEEVMVTYPQLIANKNAWEDPWKREKIEQIARLLKRALDAEGMVGLKMNVPKGKFSEVMEILPSITAPTVADLYDQDWVSVETVISSTRRKFRPQNFSICD